MKLLGSSKIKRSVCTIKAVARRHLDRHPPESEVNGEDIISSLNPSPRSIRIASGSALSLSSYISVPERQRRRTKSRVTCTSDNISAALR